MKHFPILPALLLLLPHPNAQAAEPTPKISIFGIGACARTSGTLEAWIPQMKAAGITTLRAPKSVWGAVEPKPGEFTFQSLDRQLDFLESQGIVTGALLLGNPPWNHARDRRGGLPLNNIDGWSNYVSTLVRHLNGRIRHFEVWNEAPNFTNNAPPEDYAKIVVASYQAAKAADPKALVGIAVKSVDINYLDRAIRAGAKGHFDYVTLHPYETLGAAIDSPDFEPVFMNIVPALRKMLAARDPAKTDCPVWITELGCNAARKGADIQAQALVKAYAMGIAQGFECINWFAGMDGDSGPMGLLQADGTPRPSYTAMKRMTEHLGPHPVPLGWLRIEDKGYGFAFRGDKGSVLIAWATKGNSVRVDFGQQTTVVDPATGKSSRVPDWNLTNAPVIVPDPPAKFLAEAKKNGNRPMSWGGDYSNAKSVSISMEGRTVEKGLHTRAGDAVAADVLDYGGSARAGDTPGGNVYVVDPTFLTYTTEPIEIAAVVRRNPANDPANVGLEYESTTGYKKVRPFVIPDNKEWHTARWRIDDPQFVAKWAFNFRFDPGKYYVQSVTVTKVGR